MSHVRPLDFVTVNRFEHNCQLNVFLLLAQAIMSSRPRTPVIVELEDGHRHT